MIRDVLVIGEHSQFKVSKKFVPTQHMHFMIFQQIIDVQVKNKFTSLAMLLTAHSQARRHLVSRAKIDAYVHSQLATCY